MLRYLFKRLLMLIPVLLGVTVLMFTLLFVAKQDPAVVILGDSATPESIAELREEMGLNDPYFTRLFRYIKQITRFDLGTSYKDGRPVLEKLLEVLPTTMKLALVSSVVASILGIILGVISAVRQYSAVDTILTGVALTGTSVPIFWWGLMLILIFSVNLQWLPASGSYGPEYWILPGVTLATAMTASIMRMTRSSMLEVIRQDYIRTARSKGQKEIVVVFKHALRNALIPIMTTIGINFGAQLAGSVVTESLFAISGLGKLMLDSINSLDYPVVQGGVLLIAFIYTALNTIIDMLYAFVDPRVKVGSKKNRKKRREVKNA